VDSRGGGSGSFSLPDHKHTTTAQDGGALDGNVTLIDSADFDTAVTTLISAHGIPSGMISMWSGLLSAIPSGWVLCDGNNSTPNLIAKFVRSIATASTEAGSTGGADTVTLTTAQLASHSHSASQSSHTHNVQYVGGYSGSYIGSDTKHGSRNSDGTVATSSVAPSISVGSAGSGNSHENMPAYFELIYIMKT